MRWLIVCCDGTWNTPEMASVTNVRRLHSLLDETETQESFYASGVGTTGTLLDRIDAGALGNDLDAKIVDAYRWLVTRYRPDDRIALFGFSRGAYTVRSLAGMIGRCGLLDPEDVEGAALEKRIEHVYWKGYRERTPGWSDDLPFLYDAASEDIPIRFVGVWDTVGALGIPDNLGFLRPGEVAKRTFHDLDLDPRIPTGRHAVAIDEMRGPFFPTLWNEEHAAPDQRIRQVWFAGSHMDVGGGHAERGLADVTLAWMLDEVRERTDIALADPQGQIVPNPLDVVHDDNRNQLGAGLSLVLDDTIDRATQLIWNSQPRGVPLIDPGRPSPDVHPAVYERQEGRPITSGRYRPTRVLADRGDMATVEVWAEKPWNDTGLYLEVGAYEVAPTGQWRDAREWCTACGTARVELSLLSGVGVVSRAVRTVAELRSHRDHPEWTLPGEPRQLGLPRMRLVGIVAKDATRDASADPAAHQVVDLGETDEVQVESPGYLYAYANDAWASYGDNAGSVRLRVTKTR
jgi:hypothetical protein